jgi:hypothetical protein
LQTSSAHQVLHRSFSYCTAVLRASVRKFCSAGHFCRFFCDPFVPRRSKKERLRSVRRSTLTACSAEVNRFGLRFVRAHLTGVFLRSTLTACSAEVNRFGLRFVRAHLTGVCLRSTLTACSAEVNRFGLRFVRVTIADLRRSKTGDTVQI